MRTDLCVGLNSVKYLLFEEHFIYPLILRFGKFYGDTLITSFQSGTERKKSSKSFYRKLITAILQLNLNIIFQKLNLT